jgi:fructosamine-3-kinase
MISHELCCVANAQKMVKAEYESTAALYAVAPNNVPEPWAYGCFAEDPNRFFYLQSFCDMRDTPSHDEDFVGKFVALLAQIHGKESPTGKFGFHITSE